MFKTIYIDSVEDVRLNMLIANIQEFLKNEEK